MTLCRHGRGNKELRLASCPSGPTRLVGFDRFSQNRGEATRMFWKDHLPPCQFLPYQLAKMAALALRGAVAIMPVECPTPLTSHPVQDGDRWPKSGQGVRHFLIRVSSYHDDLTSPSSWNVTYGTTSAIQRFALDDLRTYATAQKQRCAISGSTSTEV